MHGTPYKGFWYNIGAFWMLFDNRTETQNIGNTDFIILIQAAAVTEVWRASLRRFPGSLPTSGRSSRCNPSPGKGVVDASKSAPVPGISMADYHPLKLIAFSNVQFLTRIPESALLIPGTDRTLVAITRHSRHSF